MKRRILSVLVLAGILIIAGCQKPVKEKDAVDYDRQLRPGENALRKITDPAQIPDFTIACYETDRLAEAVENSLNYMAKPSSRKFFPMNNISHRKVQASLERFSDLLAQGYSGKQLNDILRAEFDVYTSVGYDGQGMVLFTGYYTPIFDGSLEPGGAYKYPLYKQPEDLVKAEDGEILGRKTAAGTIEPYPTREQIENSNMLAGNELIWLKDPFEAYIAHVQGSAKIRLPKGELVTVGYAASNGREYKSVGKQLIKEGTMTASQLSLSAMIEHFKANPQKVREYTQINPRYVFFRFSEGDPRGSLNEPVIEMRSIATDKDIYPRASLTFIKAPLPRMVAGSTVMKSYSGFFLDQDTGGAIRAPGRCDVYMGVGDEAGRLAGKTYEEGRLYYLFLKDSYMR